jgi:tetratricopeptide (TPR) repeat protein
MQPASDPRRLGLRGPDLTLIELLQRGAATPAVLLEQTIVPRDHARRVIYALMITKCLAPVDAASSSSGVRQAVTVSPPWADGNPTAEVRSPESGARTASAPVRASARPSVPSSPGSVPAWKSLATLRPPGMARQSSIPPGVASRSPTPPGGTLRPRGPTSSAPRPAEELDDLGKFRRVEQLIESRNLDEAERILDQLIERHPSDAGYLAMRAWLLFKVSSGPKVPPILVDAINEALRVDGDNPRALYTKAMTLKRVGREAEAMRLFQQVVEIDPKHLDARRELRLMQMRKKR